MDSEFRGDISAVSRDGMDRQTQLVGDFLVAQAPGHAADYGSSRISGAYVKIGRLEC